MAVAEAATAACVSTTPFGTPVEPLVATTSASPGSIGSTAVERDSPTAVDHRPRRHRPQHLPRATCQGAADRPGRRRRRGPTPVAAHRRRPARPAGRSRRVAAIDHRSATSRRCARGTTVDHERLAGDPRRVIADEERRQVGDVLGLAEASGRHRLGEPVAEVLDQHRGEVGVDEIPARCRRPGSGRSRRRALGSGG